MATQQQIDETRALLQKGNVLGAQASQVTGLQYTPIEPISSPAPIAQNTVPTNQLTTPAAPTTTSLGYGTNPMQLPAQPSQVTSAGDFPGISSRARDIVDKGLAVYVDPNSDLGKQIAAYEILKQRRLESENPYLNNTQNQLRAGISNIQSGTQATTTTPTQTSALPQTVSIVDLLNAAGQSSDFASRTQLAQQFGIQGYRGTAPQNIELGKKFREFYEAKKAAPVPESGAAARTAIQTGLQAEAPQPQDPTKQFFDIYGGMNPIEANLYQQLSTALSTIGNQQSLVDLYKQEVAAQGIPALNMELANMQRIMEGTEDDIRDEISNAGGFATESQVQALTVARNKHLLRRANYLANILNAKNDYVDRIVSLTGADRKQVSDDLNNKLNITRIVVDMNQSMTKAARENYQSIIKNIGYNGLVDSISSPQELSNVARIIGMSPQTLLQLSQIPTNEQLDTELAGLTYELSIDKFSEDKRQFGLTYALEQQKLAQKTAADNAVSPYRQRLSQVTLKTIEDLKKDVSRQTVGWGSLMAYLPETKANYFAGQVETLKAQIFANELTAMREASKTGGAVGNVSDKEGDKLSGILGSLNARMKPEQFKIQLDKVADNIYSWNAQVMSIQKGFDYQSAKDAGYSNEEIFKYVEKM